MSNPIAGTIEYLNNTRNLHTEADHGLHDAMSTHTKGQRPSKLDTDSDRDSFSSSSYEDAEDDRENTLWQSFMRRMSMTIQPLRDGDSHETASQIGSTGGGTGVAFTSGGGGGGVDSTVDHSNGAADKDCLPSIEEIAKESARAARMAELKTNYFEHPFGSSDSSGPSSQEDELAPWEQPPQQMQQTQSSQESVPTLALGKYEKGSDIHNDGLPVLATSLQEQSLQASDGQNSGIYEYIWKVKKPSNLFSRVLPPRPPFGPDEVRAHTRRHHYHHHHHHHHRDKVV